MSGCQTITCAQRPWCQSCRLKQRESDAEFVCGDCVASKFLCKPCQEGHSSFYATSGHKIVTLEEYRADPDKYTLTGRKADKAEREEYERIAKTCRCPCGGELEVRVKGENAKKLGPTALRLKATLEKRNKDQEQKENQAVVESQEKENSSPVTLELVSEYPDGSAALDIQALRPQGHLRIEVAGDDLYLSDKAVQRKLVKKDDEWDFRAACLSPDGLRCFFTRITWSQKAVGVYKLRGNGGMKLQKEVHIKDAQYLCGLSLSTANRQLAVLDWGHPRITLHHIESLQKQAVIEGEVDGVTLMCRPRYAAWDPTGDRIYVTDSGNNKSTAFVACLRVAQPALLWRTEVDDPWNIVMIGGLLYITHYKAPNVTVMSGKDGQIVRTIACPNPARGVRPGYNPGDVIISHYEP